MKKNEQKFPATVSDLLREIPGRNLKEKRERLQNCLADGLRTRFPGATRSDALAILGNLEREGIGNEEEWNGLRGQFADWWQKRKSEINKANRNGGDG